MCRLHQAEDFGHRQVAWKLEAEGGQKTDARQKLGKRLKDLEAGLAQHSSYSTQSLSVSLPVPALRTKYFSQSPTETTPSSCAAHSAIHDVADDVIRDSNTRIFDGESGGAGNTVEDNTAEKTQREGSVADPLHNRTADKCSPHPHIIHLEYPEYKNDSEYLLNNYSTGKDTSEPVTISYHRPSTEIIKAAEYNSIVKKCQVGSGANGLELQGLRRHCELSPESVQHVSSLLPQGTNNCGKKLDDSLPIPVLRAPSPVIPTVTTGQAASGSDGVRKLEGKWQVWYCLCIPFPVSLFALLYEVFGIILYLELMTPWARVLPDKLTGTQLVKKYHTLEPKGSLLHSQVPSICSYPQPKQSSPSHPSHFMKIHFNIIVPSMPRSSN